MNPEAIKNKVRSAEICEKIYDSVRFLNGVSLSRSDLESYYECNLDSIGGVPFSKVIQAAGEFVETSMDGRKVPLVLDALNIPRLDVSLLQTAIASNSKFPQSLLDIYRNKDDEFDFSPTHQLSNGLLAQVIGGGEADAVFLDSGEFSSLPEWEIVAGKLRVGGYVILHDIFFPKSFKNWLVCAAITVSSDWRVIYIDRSTPQGLMVARRGA